MQCLLFFILLNKVKNYVSYIKPEKHKRKELALKGITIPLS